MAQGSSWIDIDRVAATVGVTQVVEVGETIGLAETAAALIGYAGRAQLIRLMAINPGVIRVSRCFIAGGLCLKLSQSGSTVLNSIPTPARISTAGSTRLRFNSNRKVAAMAVKTSPPTIDPRTIEFRRLPLVRYAP
jgi:hypothetical protein